MELSHVVYSIRAIYCRTLTYLSSFVVAGASTAIQGTRGGAQVIGPFLQPRSLSGFGTVNSYFESTVVALLTKFSNIDQDC